MLNAQGFICPLCGGTMLPEDITIDHILPKSRGGSNHISNLQLAHLACNLDKDNSMEDNDYFLRKNSQK